MLMKSMLCRRKKSSVDERRMTVSVSGCKVMLAVTEVYLENGFSGHFPDKPQYGCVTVTKQLTLISTSWSPCDSGLETAMHRSAFQTATANIIEIYIILNSFFRQY